MKKIIFTALTLIVSLGAYASNEGSTSTSNSANTVVSTSSHTLQGRISDKKTNESLAGVEVSIYGSNIKTFTDFEGNFKFNNVDAGAQALVINYISYQQSVQNVYVSKENKNSVEIGIVTKE